MQFSQRNIQHIAKEKFDLIIIGGGIHGAMIAYEASLRNIKVVLVEKDDFGQHTSFNSLRIIHGGFRYLQNLHLTRLIESYREQTWFLRNFPEYVKPLPCLMPLYGKGLRRTDFSRLAVFLHRLITLFQDKKNQPLLPKGKIITPSEVRREFSHVDPDGLQGGLVWYDAILENSHRLLVDIIKSAENNGARTFNYLETKDILIKGNKASGVKVLDHIQSKEYQIHGSKIINCAGPWCRALARKFHKDEAPLFQPMLAWNVLFKKKKISDFGLAVTPKIRNGHTYFLVPWKNKLLAGTGHTTWGQGDTSLRPPEQALEHFINDINVAVPGIELKKEDILYIFSGLQSATREHGTTLAKKEVFFNHGEQGGPSNVFTVSGIKFTTARRVAEKILNRIFQKAKSKIGIIRRREELQPWNFPDNWYPDKESGTSAILIQNLIEKEAVYHLDDLVFRRTTLFENPERTEDIIPYLCSLFEWNSDRCDVEKDRLISALFPLRYHG